ncbi:3-deoxy-D-manno-octulosonic acid transferase [Pararcticibacter amylolyticus]|uniref:3-deoxy-D-manno-octulosonic acid transferase n=1 Tax=Pararcticibacter amylolyticus TaxID=2173175 RepID=A0A2U2PE70_9SPHI|nr:3-deoxy-D-manno-octulosonic acid transferase [Pararcticibacter amylolyticus]
MVFLYNLGIKLYNLLLFLSHFFNHKARLWVKGRENIFQVIADRIDTGKQHVWFHFASLGEFEQGRPVLEELKKANPHDSFIVTFFSPSGYELRKNYTLADHVFYLPLDTPGNASRFIDLVNPRLVVFTKYEYWYHYFRELAERNIPLYVISATFRTNQVFFKWYGSLNRKTLSFVTHFFVQDEFSKDILRTIRISNVTVSGDTRFDRVAENAASPKHFDDVRNFCAGSNTFVAGSSWPEDEKLIAEIVKEYPSWKFIIAPHEIKPEKIKALESLLPAGSSLKYSVVKGQITQTRPSESRVLIIDNIGMLSALYQYGSIAYIGGGFGVGIHNTLEAAAFGTPVIFGPNYHKFLEAKALIEKGGGFSISNIRELKSLMQKLQDEDCRKQAGKAAEEFVQNNKGATGTILRFLQNS